MSQIVKLYDAVCSGKEDKNFRFSDLQRLLVALGFVLSRVCGDHFIYAKSGVAEIINIQPDKRDSSKAKSVQVRQVRAIIVKYGMEVV